MAKLNFHGSMMFFKIIKMKERMLRLFISGICCAFMVHGDLVFCQNHGDSLSYEGETPGNPKSGTFHATQLTEGIYNQTQEFPSEIISLLWEGREFSDSSVMVLKQMRRKWPKLRFLHFVSPAYFLRLEKNNNNLVEKINTLILPDEKVCLLLHPWQSLLKYAGITPRLSDTFWGYSLKPNECLHDCGQEVPLTNYDAMEQEKMIQIGAQILNKYTGKKINCFMAGGWLSGPHLWPILRKLEIQHDFSYVDISLLKEKLMRYPLWNYLKNSWDLAKPFSNKKFFALTEYGALTVWPMTAATVSYNSPQKILEVYRSFLKQKKSVPAEKNEEIVFHFGLYFDILGRYEREEREILKALLQ